MSRQAMGRVSFLAILLVAIVAVSIATQRIGFAGSKYEELATFNNVLSIVEKN